MPLTAAVWDLLDRWDRSEARHAGPVQRKLGSETRMNALLADGHLKYRGKSLVRTKASEDAFTLFRLLPEDGRGIGNERAQREAGLSDGAFARARKLLIETGEAVAWKGRGGSIRRSEDVHLADRAGAAASERDLYEPFRQNLEFLQAAHEVFSAHCATADGRGQPRGGGQWSIPDVVSVIVIDLQHRFLPSREVVVRSYELKPYGQSLKLEGVYEASAHQRFAHFSTLVVEFPPDPEIRAQLDPILGECERLGVGLSRTWASEVEDLILPDRREPDTDRLNNFLDRVLPEHRLDEYHRSIRPGEAHAAGGGRAS